MENYWKINTSKAKLNLINQLFEMGRKVAVKQEKNFVQQNPCKNKDVFENDLFSQEFVVGFTYYDRLFPAKLRINW